ncbi:acetyl-CoA carboxylase biotin carboxylase subunit family protein [Streptomyces sp. NPDC087428]|uniref:ATP-grasp domain-containing protein n=1 Tax=Streptomyces sp. NPDC087428 TaxID=3365788 RepID=UPI00382E1E00
MTEQDVPAGRDALILSQWNTGGVRLAAEALRAEGYRPVLVSALADDRNRDACAAHLLIDWDAADPDAELGRLEAALTAAGVRPVAVVNMMEALIPWQVRLSRHFGLPGGEASREVLLSKAELRQAMAAAGLSKLPWLAGSAAALDPAAVDFFPAVAKPSRQSGASRHVRLVRDAASLRAHLAAIGDALGPGTEVIVEQFIDGPEFSVDGPVTDGRFHGLVVFEKTEHDEELLHDAGLSVSPPQDPVVVSGAQRLTGAVSEMCRHIGFTSGWLHVEGRALPDGTAELVEINPRPGGGTHVPAIRHLTGIDPVSALVRMALPEGWELPADGPQGPAQGRDLVGSVPVDARAVGRVSARADRDELLAVPGVFDGYVVDGYRVESLDAENFFAQAVFTAADVAGLRAVADEVRRVVRFDVTDD